MAICYLAFDYGTKRVGLAVGNDLLCTAQPIPAINTSQLHRADGQIVLTTLKPIVDSWKVAHLVFGAPLDHEGNETAQSKRIREIGEHLAEVLKLPVSFADERYTSGAADKLLREHHQQGKKFNKRKINLRDSIAAQLILQTYFAHNFR